MSAATEDLATQASMQSIESFIVREHAKLRAARIAAYQTTSSDFNKAIEALSESPLALVGAGKMGAAILESWLALGIRADWIVVVEPKPTEELLQLAKSSGVQVTSDVRKLGPVSVLFLAIKPQDAEVALPLFSHMVGNKTLIVSIMAGKRIATIERLIKRHAAIIRAMPNIAASVGRSATAACANDLTESFHKRLAYALLRTTGSVAWLESEEFMDAVTAVSGSGPAYVFLLVEELAKAGIEAGLPAELANKLARDTVSGSGELLYQSSLEANILRRNVTSPGGTTAAALNVLTSENAMQTLLSRAVSAATSRSRELAD